MVVSKVRLTRPYEIQWMPSGGEFDLDSPALDMDYFGGIWQVRPKQVPDSALARVELLLIVIRPRNIITNNINTKLNLKVTN